MKMTEESGFLFPLLQDIFHWLEKRTLTYGLCRHDNRKVDAWLVGSLVAIGCLFSFGHFGIWPPVIGLVIGVYRLCEIFIVLMKVLLTGTWADRSVVHPERSVILFMMDFFTLLVVFACACMVLDRCVDGSFKTPACQPSCESSPDCCDHKDLARPLNAFYYSVITLTTTGYGDFLPRRPSAKALTTAGSLFSVMILIQMLSRSFSLTKPKLTNSTSSDSDSRTEKS